MVESKFEPVTSSSNTRRSGDSPALIRAVLVIYRFLASLKLAVISISSLAAVLAFGTWYERDYGTVAVQQDIYQNTWFVVLLAMLAINILCAATIRFPWKRRQTGFVVTHIGLLILIFGSWYGLEYSDEGQVGAVEGGTMSQLVRTNSPMIRVREIDPANGRPIDPEYAIPFNGGAFDWSPKGAYEVVTQKKDPFKLAVKRYFAASISRVGRAADPTGSPMLRLHPMVKPPRAAQASDAFQTEDEHWLTIPADFRVSRVARKAGPARFVFHYVDRPELVEDFLKPPTNPGLLGIVRLRYTDTSGNRRLKDFRLDDLKTGQGIDLPESGLTVTFLDRKTLPVEDQGFFDALGETELNVVEFNVQKGSAPASKHMGFAGLPMIPSLIPSPAGPVGKPTAPLMDISYYLPPKLSTGTGMSGTFGVIEVMGDPQGKLYYRVYGRDESLPRSAAPGESAGVLRAGSPAPLRLGESITAFGGSQNQPMTLTFDADEYLPKGKVYRYFESFDLPVGQKGNGLPAALVEMTVGDATKEFWISRPPGLNSRFQTVGVGKKLYEVAFDFDRKDLGFSLALKKFKVDFDPGTTQASSFTSEVNLTDEAKGIKDRPITIWMNHPLTHREYTLYQSSYERLTDPETGERTGEFQSILQVGHDAGRFLKYLGCSFIVLGIFLQFYMRSGVFTDGGAKEKTKAADRARQRLASLETGSTSAAVDYKPGRSADLEDDAIL